MVEKKLKMLSGNLPNLNSELPNIYHIRSFFDDGTELCPLSEAIVVARNSKKALKLLISEDLDIDRNVDWNDPNTEIEEIGWATGDLSERIILVISGYD